MDSQSVTYMRNLKSGGTDTYPYEEFILEEPLLNISWIPLLTFI